MTLQGINWFAVAIAVTVNMLYGHFRYIPRVEKFEGEKVNPAHRFAALFTLFVYSVVLAIAVWNILLIPQVTYYWLILGIWLPFFVLPRVVTLPFKSGEDKLRRFEFDRVTFEILSTVLVFRVVLDK